MRFDKKQRTWICDSFCRWGWSYVGCSIFFEATSVALETAPLALEGGSIAIEAVSLTIETKFLLTFWNFPLDADPKIPMFCGLLQHVEWLEVWVDKHCSYKTVYWAWNAVSVAYIRGIFVQDCHTGVRNIFTIFVNAYILVKAMHEF